jgi:hypothetical protein
MKIVNINTAKIKAIEAEILDLNNKSREAYALLKRTKKTIDILRYKINYLIDEKEKL